MADQIHRQRLFVGCTLGLVATAFGFAVRGALLSDWRADFNLSQEDIGVIQGAGLYPFAISIILFSLIVDRLGYGVSMAIAFILHVSSVIITLCAPLALAPEGADPEAIAHGQRMGYVLLYVGTFIFALGNGTIEAVINPVTSTLYPDQKTHYLSILHAGWPGGLVLGGLLAIIFGSGQTLGNLPGAMWQWKMGIVLLPMLVYGVMLAGQKFPVQERVAAGVPYMDMLKEFGWGSCFIVCYLMIAGVNQIMGVFAIEQMRITTQLLLAVAPTVPFALYVKSFGRPMFVFLLLVMFLLATTELGTDSWIQDIMSSVMESPQAGPLVFIYTALIMFVLRFFAGPIVHFISPLGLLAASAAIATAGLLWLSNAGNVAWIVFLAATCYGIGKTFYWPATLGVVAEQYPKGGALMLNAIAGVGMISVGVLGNPAIGIWQDQAFDRLMTERSPELHARVVVEREGGLLGTTRTLDQMKFEQLDETDRKVVTEEVVKSQQETLARIAILPAIMFVCYVGLIFYFRAKGGYKAQVLTAEGPPGTEDRFTTGAEGPVDK